MSCPSSPSEAPQSFPRTRWSLVIAAISHNAPQSAAALETVCRDYWQPLYSYARRCGHSAHDAQDLTQGFFQHLLEKRWLDSADRDKGKLRSFLIVMLKRYMLNEWRRVSSLARGGGRAHVLFDAELAESRWAQDAGASIQADEAFDRAWALTLLNLAIDRLRQESVAAGRPGDFEALKDGLMADRGAIDYSAVARQLGMSEGAARVAAHRLRKRFREVFRQEILQTLVEGTDLDAELRHLAAVLAKELP